MLFKQIARIGLVSRNTVLARAAAGGNTIFKPVAVSLVLQQPPHSGTNHILQRHKHTAATTTTTVDPTQQQSQQQQQSQHQSPPPTSSIQIDLDVDALQKIKDTPHTPEAASVLDIVGMLDDNVDDPPTVFRQVDSNDDGQIDVDEFQLALTKLHYQRLADVHGTIHDVVTAQSRALQKKLELVLDIEDQLVRLAETTAQKRDVVYHNIGMTTAGDLDVLFAQSRLKRDTMEEKVRQLKALIEEAKSVYGVSWHVE